MNLVIVESPAKAKTINKYLGNNFKVIASFGHVRDLPSKNGSVLPKKNFLMKYEINDKSLKHIKEISKFAKQAKTIYLATDPDREGEAISWHVVEILRSQKIINDNIGFKRIAFNEITKKAVLDALATPREIDINLVNAQQARRALDYLVGFTLSPILWRKLPGCRSAGRVQSVALRLICEREEEIEHFNSQEYWDILLNLFNTHDQPFTAKLSHVDGRKLHKFAIENEHIGTQIVNRLGLEENHLIVHSITKKQRARKPAPPFITSSLQQESSKKLGFSAKKTMQIAQKLYEGVDINGETIGLITYIRTDGVVLSEDAVKNIRSLIKQLYGDRYLPTTPRLYKSKSKNAQEAHEAIRPTDITLTLDKCASALNDDQLKLYELIWKRTVACQMENVVIDMIGADLSSYDNTFTARATGSIINFDGFYKIYQENHDNPQEPKNKLLPILFEGEKIKCANITLEKHLTEPPARFSEASLVNRLEELGIGRPSTYASIISVLQERNYVRVEKKKFFTSDLGRLVTTFLVGFFKKYVEYDFTASLEHDLDRVAEGDMGWKDLLHNFWHGFSYNVSEVSNQNIVHVIDYVEKSLDFYLYGEAKTDNYKKNKKCPLCMNKIGLKLSKYGAFLSCSNYPDCTFKRQISAATNNTTDSSTQPITNNGTLLGQNTTGEEIYLKQGPYGWYVQKGKTIIGEDTKKTETPKRSPVPASIHIKNLDLSMAIKLLDLPITIGQHPETNNDIIMGIGKFGPYLKYQNTFSSINKSVDPFKIQLDQAVKILKLKQAKKKI